MLGCPPLDFLLHERNKTRIWLSHFKLDFLLYGAKPIPNLYRLEKERWGATSGSEDWREGNIELMRLECVQGPDHKESLKTCLGSWALFQRLFLEPE